mmetsp:Transcript_64624/g.140701  ORF Transcript_64624/g.140701 Transcript_64624/m.140701 type:complete len:559 (+) Transcript_64624:42-1718(+)
MVPPIAERPWQHTPGSFEAKLESSAFADSRFPDSVPWFDASVTDTLYENQEGQFISDGGERGRLGGSHAEAARRCCVFAPEPQASGASAVSSAFRSCKQVTHCTLQRGIARARGPVSSFVRQWGTAGAVLAMLLERRTLLDWIVFEDWVLCILLHILEIFQGFWRRCQRSERHGPAPFPMISWNPHRDMMATLSSGGMVAVHSMGDAFSSATTQYVCDDGSGGFPLCISWQPDNLCGTLAVGMSAGVAVWRRGRNDGWSRCWSISGQAFACSTLSWSPDGRVLAAAGSHGVVRVWPHSELLFEQATPWCVTLRRWSGGSVSAMQWSPDGTLLAVFYDHSGMVRLWCTRSWKMEASISLRTPRESLSGTLSSMAWCSNETLLLCASGHLLELRGLGATSGWAAGFGPYSRELHVPHLRGADGTSGGASRAVVEVSVCPRTAQRVALRLHGGPHVLIFDRQGSDDWMKQELTLRGLVSSAAPRGSSGSASSHPMPCSVAFAGSPVRRSEQSGLSRWDALYEGSLLAVYWDFGERGQEVRTYPMYHLPCRRVQYDPGVLLD